MCVYYLFAYGTCGHERTTLKTKCKEAQESKGKMHEYVKGVSEVDLLEIDAPCPPCAVDVVEDLEKKADAKAEDEEKDLDEDEEKRGRDEGGGVSLKTK